MHLPQQKKTPHISKTPKQDCDGIIPPNSGHISGKKKHPEMDV